MTDFTLSAAASVSIRERFPFILFDESHCQAWSIDRDAATTINPTQPDDASYAEAAARLEREGFRVGRLVEGGFTKGSLEGVDTVVIPHFGDPRSERTTGHGDHRLTAAEIDTLATFVESGGGLVVLAEHEHDKYGNNINELLSRFGVRVVHESVIDTANNFNGVVAWVKPELTREVPALVSKVSSAVLYRTGTLEATGEAKIVARTAQGAAPAGAPVIVSGQFGQGRFVVVADSDCFGDDSVADADHLQLFSNIVTWVSATSSGKNIDAAGELPAEWLELKGAVGELRSTQSSDGSVNLDNHDETIIKSMAARARAAYVKATAPHGHDAAFHAAVLDDFDAWVAGNFAVPDFVKSLQLFHPDEMRVDGLEHIVMLPMYTQNGNPDRVFEAIWIRTVWPDWIAELEAGGFRNPAFVPIEFVDFTSGYDTHSAVFFPETVATSFTPKFTWGGIFCDREAARFRAVTSAAAETLRIDLPADVELMLNDPRITQETYVLWDLVHDRQHSLGELPFDPFMIKQRSPYWMYSLEELRCDLSAYLEMNQLSAMGVPHARLVKYAVLFDRLLRFPISGDRTRNYDGLVGQIIFAHLHRRGALRWENNTMSLDWDNVDDAVRELSDQINALYRDGIDHSKMSFWIQARNLVRGLVPPHPGSRWEAGIDYARPTKELLDEILPDEFPLNVFYEALAKKLAPVIESVKGATL